MATPPRPDAAALAHQDALLRLSFHVQRHVLSRGLGAVYIAPTALRLGETSYQPDLMAVLGGGSGSREDRLVDAVPDLICEVLLPASAYEDLRLKRRRYAEAGVREYWIVDPMEPSVEVYALRDRGYTLAQHVAQGTVQSSVLEGFSIPTASLFVV
jgi:Uma2 family endonuclease